MTSSAGIPSTLFVGCEPNVLADGRGWILAVGPGARAAAPAGTQVVELAGQTLPGLGDSHIHLDELVHLRVGLDLHRTRSLAEVLEQVRRATASAPPDGWILGRGWNRSLWPEPRWPSRHDLDQAGGGRPVLLASKDEHSLWASSAALSRAGITKATPDPPDGLIDREGDGNPSGIVREAGQLFTDILPRPGRSEYLRLLEAVLADLAAFGLCSLHTMDPSETLFCLQRLQAEGRLPLRVVVNLPVGTLGDAERVGIRSGFGGPLLRIWGIKAFLDGSLGSLTAEMLDGSGVARIPDPELDHLIERCQAAELNLCLHAIGDGAVRRALTALERHPTPWPLWRPRIEHAQCVEEGDLARFRSTGAVASMQPLHAVSDRETADAVWGPTAAHAYSWAGLARAGVPLAFGSDAPGESPDPLLGIDAATSWRARADWYPDQALTEAQALAGYTTGLAFAAGMERECGQLAPGYRCDLTVVGDGAVNATVVGGRVAFLRAG
ncbi:MAG TPA: amidohydrolase [Candidatus Dormibacteraeota bacterium]